MLFENKKHEVYTRIKNKITLHRDHDKMTHGVMILARGYSS